MYLIKDFTPLREATLTEIIGIGNACRRISAHQELVEAVREHFPTASGCSLVWDYEYNDEGGSDANITDATIYDSNNEPIDYPFNLETYIADHGQNTWDALSDAEKEDTEFSEASNQWDAIRYDVFSNLDSATLVELYDSNTILFDEVPAAAMKLYRESEV